MHTYKIYDENFEELFKQEWFSPKKIEDFYDEKEKSIIFETEKKYLEAASLFINTSFSICELEKYREYYGINHMKKIYSSEYPDELLKLFENLQEDGEYSVSDAMNMLKLIFRGHIWCILKFADDTRIFFEKPGILTILTVKNHHDDVKNIKNLKITHKDLQ